jgi:hypothetical protein
MQKRIFHEGCWRKAPSIGAMTSESKELRHGLQEKASCPTDRFGAFS